MKNNNGTKIESLQSVRALAFLGVLTTHCGGAIFGQWGVSVFIVLSGFLMMYTYYDRTLETSFLGSIKFSWKKIKKLYPLHVFMTVAVGVLLIWDLMSEFSIKEMIKLLGKFLINITLLQAWFSVERINFSFNGASWYLSLCVFLYVAFPFILKQLKKKITSSVKAIRWIFVIFGLQCLVGVMFQFVNTSLAGIAILKNAHIYNLSKWFIYIFPVFRLGDFTIGCCLGYLFLQKRPVLNKWVATVCEIAVMIAIVISQRIYVNQIGFLGSESFRYTMLYTPTTVCLIYLFALNAGFVSKYLTCKPVIYLGNISAYTFLIHAVVIKYLNALCTKVLHMNLNLTVEVILVFILTILCTEIYKKLEKLFQNRKYTQPARI